MSTMMIRQELSYPRKVLKARLARAVVLHQFGCELNDWRVMKRTQNACKACRVFAYIAHDIGLTYQDIADLCVWSTHSVRDALEYMENNPALRLRAETIRAIVEDHAR